jgi:hypothetical protein
MAKKDDGGFIGALLYIIIDLYLRRKKNNTEEGTYELLGYDESKIHIKKIK